MAMHNDIERENMIDIWEQESLQCKVYQMPGQVAELYPKSRGSLIIFIWAQDLRKVCKYCWWRMKEFTHIR